MGKASSSVNISERKKKGKRKDLDSIDSKGKGRWKIEPYLVNDNYCFWPKGRGNRKQKVIGMRQIFKEK